MLKRERSGATKACQTATDQDTAGATHTSAIGSPRSTIFASKEPPRCEGERKLSSVARARCNS
eukprot:3065871-Pyramimonas_sp.AAC.1